jgi:hypothetical protein
VKFKAISQYFGQLSKRRHCEISLYRQKKRSPIEYRKQNVLGRKRDRLKAKHAQRAKRKNKPRKTKNNKLKKTKDIKLKTKSHSKASTYKPISNKQKRTVSQISNEEKRTALQISNKQKRTASQISKLKFITVDYAKTIMLQSQKKILKGKFAFPLLPCVCKISVDTKKFVIRYYNQQMFIYTASIGTNRPLKRNLIATFSTLNGDEMESNWYTEHTRFSPVK